MNPKLIVWAPSREAAIDRMKRALDTFVLLGVRTNIEFLHRVISTADFASGKLDTGFLNQHPKVFIAAEGVPYEAILAASLPPRAETRREAAGEGSGTTFPDAWTSGPWRNS